ncbi:MAG: alanine racemase [Candidatus Lindowbacteria bacterium]|nr:alanine racemase [Candidatus Lindowbacteria bacterium]
MAIFALSAQSERATWAEVSLKNIRSNYSCLKKSLKKDCKLMAIVKANAYGHGAGSVSKALEEEGVDFLGVAAPFEGALLRAAGVQVPIVVLSPTSPEQAEIIAGNNLIPAISSIEMALALDGRRVKAHVKVNTGMNRCGVEPEKISEFLTDIASKTDLQIEGIFSQLAGADDIDRNGAYNQFDIFESLLRELRSKNLRPPIAHISNSAAVLDMPEMNLDLVRTGLSLYGMYPSEFVSRSLNLAPVLSWKAKVVETRELQPGESVSYGSTYTATKPTRVALLPVGYADGYRRSLSNRAEVLIRGERCKVAGKVCMDLTVVECGEMDVHSGDEVVLIGSQGEDSISIEEMAAWLDTINYEVTTQITERVPRHYLT